MSDVSSWSTTAGGNTSAAPDGAPEGMAPAGVNDTIREVMAAVARWYQGTVEEVTLTQTFALADRYTIQVLTGTTTRVWTIPTNASVAFPESSIIVLCARDTAEIDVSPATGVTLTSIFGSGNDDVTVLAGGTAVIMKVDTDEWMISGDIVPV